METTTTEQERIDELLIENMMLTKSLNAAMQHLILLRAGKLSPEWEAQRYAQVLAQADAAVKWTSEEKR